MSKDKKKYEIEAYCKECGVRYIEYTDLHWYSKLKDKQPFPSVCDKCMKLVKKRMGSLNKKLDEEDMW